MSDKGDIVWRIGFIGVGLCAALACSDQPAGRPYLPLAASPVHAEVTAVDASGVMIRTSGSATPERLTWSGPEQPRYRRDVVRPAVHRCDPAVGDRVLVARLDGVVLSVLRETDIRDGNPRYELCHLSTYYDVSATSARPPREHLHALSLALSMLEDRQLAYPVFIRGPADDLLRLYPDAKGLATSALRYGQPELAPFAEQVIALKTQLRGRRMLAEAIPFRYTRPGERTVGLRGFFLVRVFEDTGDSLALRLDLSSHVRPPQEPPSPGTRAGLEQAAAAEPFVFAMVLAQAGVPSGVVLRESEWRAPAGHPDFSLARPPLASVQALARAFNARHSDQHAAVLDDVLVMHHGSKLPELLRRPSGVSKGEIVGAMPAVRRVWSGIDPALASAGGQLGSTINADPEDRSGSARIVFDGSEARIVDALNAIARQTKKTWLVVVDRDAAPAIAQVGFVNRGGSTSLVPVRLTRDQPPRE